MVFYVLQAVVCELLLRQLKIDVLSVLVVTDKLDFGEPQASGNLSPQGRQNHSPAWSRHAAERWVWNKT